MGTRRTGLGTMGLADALIKMKSCLWERCLTPDY